MKILCFCLVRSDGHEWHRRPPLTQTRATPTHQPSRTFYSKVINTNWSTFEKTSKTSTPSHHACGSCIAARHVGAPPSLGGVLSSRYTRDVHFAHDCVSGTVGNTPLIRLRQLSELTGCNILAKAEHLNPGYSVKDRAALFMIEAAEKAGTLKHGGTVIEATAGNTGLGLVLVANAKGYKCRFFVPESTSSEKIGLLRRLGAHVEVCPAVTYDNPQHFQRAAADYAEKNENCHFTAQFWNEANFKAHYQTTGPEVWQQTDGKVDAFICAAGTGGTIGGTSVFLKEKTNGAVKCFLMDPSSVGIKYHVSDQGEICLSEKTPEEKKLNTSSVMEGIGSAKLYFPLSKARINGVLTSHDDLAFEMANWLLRHEGLFVGPSAGLNVLGALWLASRLGPGHTVVTVLCDSGSSYISRNTEWLESKGVKLRPDVTAEQLLKAFDASKHVKIALPGALP